MNTQDSHNQTKTTESLAIFKDIQQREIALQDAALSKSLRALQNAPLDLDTRSHFSFGFWATSFTTAACMVLTAIALFNSPPPQHIPTEIPLAENTQPAQDNTQYTRFTTHRVLNTPGTLEIATLAQPDDSSSSADVKYVSSGIINEKMTISDPLTLKRL